MSRIMRRRALMIVTAVILTEGWSPAHAVDQSLMGGGVSLANAFKPSRILLGNGISASNGMNIYPYLETMVIRQGGVTTFSPIPDLSRQILVGSVAQYAVTKQVKLSVDAALGRTYMPSERDMPGFATDTVGGDMDNVWRMSLAVDYRLGPVLDAAVQIIRSNMMPSQYLQHANVFIPDKEYQDMSLTLALRYRFQ
jgi:hypothetical protein